VVIRLIISVRLGSESQCIVLQYIIVAFFIFTLVFLFCLLPSTTAYFTG